MTAPTGLQCHIELDGTVASPIWRDATPAFLLDSTHPVQITRGRTEELGQIEPSSCGLFLDNSDGSFTPGKTTSTWYPYFTSDKGIRLRFPDTTGNIIVDSEGSESATFEGGTVGNWQAFFGSAAISNSSTRAWQGTKSLRIAYTDNANPLIQLVPDGLVNGLTYTVSGYFWVPSGQPTLSWKSFDFTGSTGNTLFGQWERVSHTFTVPTTHSRANGFFIGIGWNTAEAGDEVWVDGLMINEGSSAATFTTTGQNHNYRFSGYIGDAVVQWPGGSHFCVTQVSAYDIQARLARHELDAVGVEQCKATPEILCVYPMNESQGTALASDASGVNLSPSAVEKVEGSGGGDDNNQPITFGENGPVGVGGSVKFWSGSTAADHNYLHVDWKGTDPLGSLGWAYNRALVVAFKLASTARAGTIMQLRGDQGFGLEIGSRSDGKVYMAGTWGSGAEFWSSDTTTDYSDNKWHTAILVADYGGFVYRLYIDGSLALTNNYGAFLWGTAHHHIYLGGKPAGQGIRGWLACAAVIYTPGSDLVDATEAAAISNAILNGFKGLDSSDERIARYLAYAGVPTTMQMLEPGVADTIDHIDTRGNHAWDVIAVVNKTEGGVVHASPSGKVHFKDRYCKFNATAGLTIDQQGVSEETTASIDNQNHINRVTVTSESLGEVVVENTDDIALRGQYHAQYEIATTDLNELRATGEFLVARYSGDPKLRLNRVIVNLTQASSAETTAAQSLEICDWITLNGLDSTTFGVTTLTEEIDGYSETISLDSWAMEFYTTPSLEWQVLLLNDTDLGKIDTANIVMGY